MADVVNIESQDVPVTSEEIQNISEVVQNIAEEIVQNIPEVVQNIPEVVQNIPEVVQNMPEVVQNIPEAAQISDSEKELNDRIGKVEEELRVRTEERENFKNRMQQAEIQLATYAKNGTKTAESKSNEQVKIEMERDENKQLRDVIANMKIVVKDKTNAFACQELQMKALETQVAALKEVASLTKGMLSIRNRENEKLKEQIDLTQKKIESERVRNSAVLKKTELASSLNAQLREEYLNQVKLFGELKGKYEKKINVLTEELARIRREKEAESEETVDQ